MTTDPNVGPAKIYKFPLRGRFAGNCQLENSAAKISSPGVAKTVFGGSWYHEEAIQNERARKD